jgi:hypothetical protein
MKEPSVSEVRAMAADALAALKQIFASLSPAQMIDTDAPFTMMKCFHNRDSASKLRQHRALGRKTCNADCQDSFETKQTPAATGGAHGIETFVPASNAKELE